MKNSIPREYSPMIVETPSVDGRATGVTGATLVEPSVFFAELPSDFSASTKDESRELKKKSLRKKRSLREGISNLFLSHSKKHTSVDKLSRQTPTDDEFRTSSVLEIRVNTEVRIEPPSGPLASRPFHSSITANHKTRTKGPRPKRDKVVSILGGLV